MRLLRTLLLLVAFGVWFPMPAVADSPMTFFMETNTESRFFALMTGGVFNIYASGVIAEGTTESFLAFVQAHKVEMAKVHFDSLGGSLAEGMKLGRAIRALGFQTTIGIYTSEYVEGANKSAVCASACAYAYAGGTSRFLDESTGRLGVHQFYSKYGSPTGETVQQVSGLIVAYLDEMGIDAKAFTLATGADRNGMVWLSPAMALRLRFANNGVDPPVAEIRLSEMRPYLRVQQDFHNVTTRILFRCGEGRLFMDFGIVTNPETSGMIMSFPKRSYLELDFVEFLEMPGAAGAATQDSTVWLGRELTPADLTRLVGATRVDGWVDGSGAVRWGAQLDMPAVKDKIIDFARQCYVG